ncbi:uncharacterized protein LOC115210502 [Octopus sinensis]|uniref:Uncharacterized protein LOC115210502 n=1 Tax=Octopus sinensis TaxID=2607531 RepID=A0A6P7S9V3_9MOLL|nr:uncharacterized protein LOC115210502 [Octopus sinensis]
MRSLIQTGQPTTQFSEMFLKIGNGQITSDDNGYIDTTTIGHTISSPVDLCSAVYLNLTMEYIKPGWLRDRAVLAPTNAAVNTLNYDLLSQLPSQERCYRSVDTVNYLNQVTHFPTGLPPHELHLKVGCPVILLRNLNAPTLCNGTRLVVKQMMDHVIEAQIITGHDKNDTAFIQKIPLNPIDCSYPMQRLQFLLKLSFAMTINKAQGQSLKVVGLDLRTSCFSHGQFYVGCSRVNHPDNISLLLKEKPKMSTKQPYSIYSSTAIFTSTLNCSR